MGVVNFQYTREGEGTSAPDNIRNIIAPLNIDGIGEIYRGYLDTETFELVETWKMHQGLWKDWNFRFKTGDNNLKYLPITKGEYEEPSWASISNATTLSWTYTENANPHFYFGGSNIYMFLPVDFDEEQNVQACAPLVTPVRYKLTQAQFDQVCEQLKTYLGYDIPFASMEDVKRRIHMNEPHIVVPSAHYFQEYETNIAAPLKECVIHFKPVQEGTPSPDNPVPITGWTGLKVQTGINNEFVPRTPTTATSYGVNFTMNEDGSIDYEGTPTSYSAFHVGRYYVKGGETVYMRIVGQVNNMTSNYPSVKDANGNVLSSGLSDPALLNGLDLSSYPDAYYVTVDLKRLNNNVYMKGRCRIWVGTDIDAYRSYNISWDDEAGTIYGGYLNLTTGKLVATHKSVTFDGSEGGWNIYGSSTNFHFWHFISDKKAGRHTSICSIFENDPDNYGSSFWDSRIYGQYADHTTIKNIYVNAPYDMPGGVTEWRAWLAEHPMQLCYELATPIEYQINPIVIKTYKAQNNIWSNSNGNIEIKYWKH